MTCVVCAESRLHETHSNFQLLPYINLMISTEHNSKLQIKIHVLSHCCKTSLNPCKCSITILISPARLHNTAVQGKRAWLAGRDSGHGRERQQRVPGSRTASFIPATDSSHAHREEGGREGRQRSRVSSTAWRGSTPIHHLSEPCTTASQNCKSSQLPPALL